MSFIENLYLRGQMLKLQEKNKNLKKILSEAPGDRLQRLNARYAREQYTRLPRHPYPGQHPTKYEGGWSLQLMPMYPPQEPYPYNRPDPYPGQHPVGKSTVNEAAQVTKMSLASNDVPNTSPIPNQIPSVSDTISPKNAYEIHRRLYDYFVDELDKCLSGVYQCDQQTMDSLMDRVRYYTELLRGTD